MKHMKKLLASVACAGLLLTGVPVVTYGATGSISFSDPQTAVGDNVQVKCVISISDDTLVSDQVTLCYDTSAMKFVSGDKVQETSAGTLTCTGTAGAKEESFVMTFQAIREGGTQVQVANYSVNTKNDSGCNLYAGVSTITVAAGDPSKIASATATSTDTTSTDATADSKNTDGSKEDSKDSDKTDDESTSDKKDDSDDKDDTKSETIVKVDKTSYTISDFDEKDLPEGYEKITVKYKGEEYSMGYKEETGVYLAYLKDEDENCDFFLYDESKATFSPYEEVSISDSASIIILSEMDEELPSRYVETTLKLNGKKFPVWQDSEKDGYYLIYAIDNKGEKCFYEYDSDEETYQKYEVEETDSDKDDTKTDEVEQEKTQDGLMANIRNMFNQHFVIFSILLLLIFFVLILRVLILRVELKGRDDELDEMERSNPLGDASGSVQSNETENVTNPFGNNDKDDWLEEHPKKSLKSLFGSNKKEENEEIEHLRTKQKQDAAQMARLRQENESLLEGNGQLSEKVMKLKGESDQLREQNTSLAKLLEEAETKVDEARNLRSDDSIVPPTEGAQEIDLIPVIKKVIDGMTPRCVKSGIRLELSTSCEEIKYLADENHIGCMISNIVDNSIKYMQKGGHLVITISSADNSIFIAFKDNGNGLPEREISNIFDLNFQGSNKVSGNGLGLYQVKAIVEHYHGSIHAHSSNGMGIYIQLPIDVKE